MAESTSDEFSVRQIDRFTQLFKAIAGKQPEIHLEVSTVVWPQYRLKS